ncbi:hypothetical protein D3C80_1864450 [compost metagenome]
MRPTINQISDRESKIDRLIEADCFQSFLEQLVAPVDVTDSKAPALSVEREPLNPILLHGKPLNCLLSGDQHFGEAGQIL